MPARLILNADDFGLTPGINRAIAELHTAGVLTSATLMASGPAFDDAVRIALAHPTLGVGCHIVLTDGTPVSDPATLPTLCPNGRTFRPSLIDFARDLLLNRVAPAEIECEALAQVQKIQRSGIDVTHIDTHKHTHIFPTVATELIRIIGYTSVAAIRNPFEPANTRAQASLKRRLQINLLDTFKSRYECVTWATLSSDGTFGISATGNLNAATLRQILNSIPSHGLYELLCHPGYNDRDLDALTTRLRSQREVEYQALLSEIPKFSSDLNAPRLIHYGNIGAFGTLREEGLFTPDTGYETYP